jgi:hypothetical protein
LGVAKPVNSYPKVFTVGVLRTAARKQQQH